MIIFLDLPGVEVEGVEVAEEIRLSLRTMSPTALCPLCETASSRIQSRYTRTLRDLPSLGRPIRLIMHVRRFFCQKSTCAQKIFIERLPDLCRPHAEPHQAAARGAPPVGIHCRGRSWKRAGHEWQPRYHLASASPIAAI